MLLKFTLKNYKTVVHFFFNFNILIIHVGGTYFINHKTKDYFAEGARILDLSICPL